MVTHMSELTHDESWLALVEHFKEMKDVHMRDMFEDRFENCFVKINDILYDFIKTELMTRLLNYYLNLQKTWVYKIVLKK